MSPTTMMPPPPVVEPSPQAAPVNPPPPAAPSVDHDPARILLHGLSWTTYLRILDETGDRRRARLAFNRGVLELMSPGPIHEGDSYGFDRVISITTEEARIPCRPYGSTTWKRDDAEKGLEADECYYFTADKMSGAATAARRKSKASSDYPFPDLAIEVDMRRPAVDRAEIYAALGVPEVWSFDDERLQIDQLGDEGTYHEVAQSRFIPLRSDDIVRWVLRFEQAEDVTAWAIEFRDWVRAELAGRG